MADTDPAFEAIDISPELAAALDAATAAMKKAPVRGMPSDEVLAAAEDARKRMRRDARTPALTPIPEAREADPESESIVLKQRLLRLQQDFDGYRTRVQRERKELERKATDKAVLLMLPILDELERALPYLAEAPDTVRHGFQHVRRAMDRALNELDVRAMETDGQAFDVNFHESMGYGDSDGPPDETQRIVRELRRGYMSGDVVLRPAQVLVSRVCSEVPVLAVPPLPPDVPTLPAIPETPIAALLSDERLVALPPEPPLRALISEEATYPRAYRHRETESGFDAVDEPVEDTQELPPKPTAQDRT